MYFGETDCTHDAVWDIGSVSGAIIKNDEEMFEIVNASLSLMGGGYSKRLAAPRL